jgi:hypothetical protein
VRGTSCVADTLTWYTRQVAPVARLVEELTFGQLPVGVTQDRQFVRSHHPWIRLECGCRTGQLGRPDQMFLRVAFGDLAGSRLRVSPG